MILPTIRQLQYLLALKRHGSFSRAADECRVTQSTLSAGIKELETLLDAQVVERTKRRVVFTPFGEAVLVYAARVVREAEDLVQFVESRRAPLSGPLRLGAIPTIGPFLLPRGLKTLRRRYPELQLYLTEDLTERLIDQLQSGALDATIMALPYDVAGLHAEPLGEDPFLFATVDKTEAKLMAGKRASDLKQNELLLLNDGHCLRDHVVEACRLSSRPQTFSATSLFTLVQMVAGGLGTTLLPAVAVKGGILKGTPVQAVPLGDPPPMRTIALVWRETTGRTDDFERLADVLRTELGRIC